MPVTPGTTAGSLSDSAGSGNPKRRAPLSRERIVRAALRVMDEDGLEAVSMRRVGRELGVEAMSLYNHVKDKDDLLAGIVEAVMSDFEFPPAADDWRESARRVARAWRNILKAHPLVITLMSEQRKPVTSVQALRPMEHALEVVRRSGLPESETFRTFRAFGGYIQGYVLAEIANMFGGQEIDVRPEDVTLSLPVEELPILAANLHYLGKCDFDEEFEYGLDLMIRGVEAKTANSSG